MYMKIFEKYNDYFKANTNKIQKLTNNANPDNYKLKFYKLDETKNIVDVIDKSTNKLLLKCEYMIAGYYNIANSIWTWAWNNPYTEKNLNIDKDVFMELKNTIHNSKISQEEIEEIIYFLDDTSIYLSHNNMEKLTKFIMYSLESPMIISKKNDDNQPSVIEIIAIKEILQIK